MFLKYEALESHLQKELAPLYILTGDEHLLALEAADRIRHAARTRDFTEREVLTVRTQFQVGPASGDEQRHVAFRRQETDRIAYSDRPSR